MKKKNKDLREICQDDTGGLSRLIMMVLIQKAMLEVKANDATKKSLKSRYKSTANDEK